MKLDSRQEIGDVGESRVATAFVEIGWANPLKVPRDLGDDFITFARSGAPRLAEGHPSSDPRPDLFDLSAPVLLQVKSSATEFSAAKSRHNGRGGWWFYESSADHFDHWLRYDIPYLLILHDLPSKNSYWAHVHGAAIESTHNGRRIFVPADQRVEAGSAPLLNEVAVSARTSMYAHLHTLRDALTPGQRLRHALLTPRLFLPFSVTKKVAYDQVAAMLMLDMRQIINFAVSKGSCPEPNSWRTHRSWGWRFVQALWEVLNGSEPAELARLSETARSRYERDACRVVCGSIAYVEQRPSVALIRFVPDRYSKPIDRAWLLTQRAQTLLELGDTKAAAEAANAALNCLSAQAGDVSVTVIRASATGCQRRSKIDPFPTVES